MFESEIKFIRNLYSKSERISLHEPKFFGNEKKYLNECIDSTFVSSVGKFVDTFESKIAKYTGSKYAVATSNGTSAIHIALLASNVSKGDEVITQPLTFVATCNAITYCGASPIFVDVDISTMGLSPESLIKFLKNNAVIKDNQCINKITGNKIKACLPMHTFGHPCKIDEIKLICENYNIKLIEDAAESVGSFFHGKHTGTYGSIGAFSFNGNKIITGGGGGCIITDDEDLALKAKHLSTTAKIPHQWEYKHDAVGYNYRMPNINAALLVAQLENLEIFLLSKRKIATAYRDFFIDKAYDFMEEPLNSKSNYWLNTIIFNNKSQRDLFLKETNLKGIQTRPVWGLMNKLNMYQNAHCEKLNNAEWLEKRIVNIPSSASEL
jgi:perosamine synthetase